MDAESFGHGATFASDIFRYCVITFAHRRRAENTEIGKFHACVHAAVTLSMPSDGSEAHGFSANPLRANEMETEMASFMIRIELHGAIYQDYVNLHSYMTQEGCINTIHGDDGATYQLPPAEYNLVANCTLNQAHDKTSRAAQKTLKKFAVVVSQYGGAIWSGLSKVQQRATI